jgi:hypothetical protein
MATLQIRKETNKVWKHVPSDALPYIVSKLYIKSDGDFIRVVEQGGSQRGQYNFADVSVYNIGGSAETFTSAQQLMERLEALNYIGFFYEGEVSPSELISSDVGNSIELGTDGKLFSAGGGGGSTDWSDLTNFASLDPATTPLADDDEFVVVQGGVTKRVAKSDVGGGGSSANKQIFHWWGGNWTISTLEDYFYIGLNNVIGKANSSGLDATSIATAMNGRNKGLFVAPFDCKIKRVLFKEASSGTYTGSFILASGLPNYDGTWNLGYSNIVTHLNESIISLGANQNIFEFEVTDDITVPKGYVVSPILYFTAQAGTTKAGIEISVEIEEVI